MERGEKGNAGNYEIVHICETNFCQNNIVIMVMIMIKIKGSPFYC